MENIALTPVELELMEILWLIGGGTVREVIAHLSRNRHLAYTSVSTMLRILQQKQIVRAEKAGKHHIYRPLLTRETYARHSVKKMVKQIFSGDSLQLVAYLLDKQELSQNEIDTLQRLLDAKKKA